MQKIYESSLCSSAICENKFWAQIFKSSSGRKLHKSYLRESSIDANAYYWIKKLFSYVGGAFLRSNSRRLHTCCAKLNDNFMTSSAKIISMFVFHENVLRAFSSVARNKFALKAEKPEKSQYSKWNNREKYVNTNKRTAGCKKCATLSLAHFYASVYRRQKNIPKTNQWTRIRENSISIRKVSFSSMTSKDSTLMEYEDCKRKLEKSLLEIGAHVNE